MILVALDQLIPVTYKESIKCKPDATGAAYVKRETDHRELLACPVDL
jgi:hypothetical protein